MKRLLIFLFIAACVISISSCKDESDSKKINIADDIVGEWVYDNPEEEAWQSMKFVSTGAFFCYSDNKDKWTEALKNINKGNYGVKENIVSAAFGNSYLDMTVSRINGYEFTARFNETTVDLTFHKVVMRTHLNYGESILPEYKKLVDTDDIIGYKSHDESVASVDSSTGEITAICNNGRTYVDIITASGTAVVKVMIGKVNDGDEKEISPISKNDVTVPPITLNVSKAILGKWIFDEAYWESIDFLENGKMYYSNADDGRNIKNDYATGTYSVNKSNNRLTMKVQPTGGTQMQVVMEIIKISTLSFTARFFAADGSDVGKYTYAKQLTSVEMTSGDSEQLDFASLIGNETVISSYKSHNPEIAEVDSNTGKITAHKGGRTYIDIITDNGTAVAEVIVKNFMEFNYEDFIGVNKNTVTGTFEYLYTTEGDDIIYNYRRGSLNEGNKLVKDANWDQILFRFNPSTGLVSAVSLLAKENVWFTPEEMTNYLSKKFHPYTEGTTADVKAFMNAETLDEATVGITWDTKNGILTFVQITHKSANSELDFGDYLGKTKAEVKDMMKGYSITSETDNYVGFNIGSAYIRIVKFTLNTTITPSTVKQVDIWLSFDIERSFVESELEKKYKYSDGKENEHLNYYSDDKKIRVVYNIGTNMIQFIKR